MPAARPCTCDRIRPGEPYRPDLGQCVRCWLYHHKPAVNRAWGGSGDVIPVDPAAAPPCRHRGDELSAADVRRLAEPIPLRRWYWCGGPPGMAPAGQPVSGCSGCNPQCPGYAADDPEAS